jgi:hypothetical protein
MDRTDPSGKRILEAFKRMQLLLRKEQVVRQPFSRFMIGLQDAYNHPILGAVFGKPLLRLLGAEPRAARRLYTDEELRRTRAMSFADLAEDALAAKLN